PYEAERDAHDASLLNGTESFSDLADTWIVESLNDSPDPLRALKPDVLLDFGTGKLSPEVLAVPRLAALNLHGGDPERYRGLDTHLWAVCQLDFEALVTTIHHMDATLD